MDIPLRFIIEDDDLDLLYRFTAYMEDIVVHAGIDYNRRQTYQKWEILLEESHQDSLLYEAPFPSNKDEFEFEEDKLSKAFYKLNLLRRQILKLVFFEGLSAQETADKLNCSVNYVYLQKHRALKALQKQLMDGR